MSLTVFAIALVIFTFGLGLLLRRGAKQNRRASRFYHPPAKDGTVTDVNDLPPIYGLGKPVKVLRVGSRGEVTGEVVHTGELVGMRGHYKAVIRKDNGVIVKRAIYRVQLVA